MRTVTLLFLAAIVFVPTWMAFEYMRDVIRAISPPGAMDGQLASPSPPPLPSLPSRLMDDLFALAALNPSLYFLCQVRLPAPTSDPPLILRSSRHLRSSGSQGGRRFSSRATGDPSLPLPFLASSSSPAHSVRRPPPSPSGLAQFLIALALGMWFLYLEDINEAMARWKASRAATSQSAAYRPLDEADEQADDVEATAVQAQASGPAVDLAGLKREFHRVIDAAEELEIRTRVNRKSQSDSMVPDDRPYRLLLSSSPPPPPTPARMHVMPAHRLPPEPNSKSCRSAGRRSGRSCKMCSAGRRRLSRRATRARHASRR